MYKVIEHHEIWGAQVVFMGRYDECVNYTATHAPALYCRYQIADY